MALPSHERILCRDKTDAYLRTDKNALRRGTDSARANYGHVNSVVLFCPQKRRSVRPLVARHRCLGRCEPGVLQAAVRVAKVISQIFEPRRPSAETQTKLTVAAQRVNAGKRLSSGNCHILCSRLRHSVMAGLATTSPWSKPLHLPRHNAAGSLRG